MAPLISDSNPPVAPRPDKRYNFSAVADKITELTGSSRAFGFSAALILIWMIAGPFFHYSDAWQLAINSTTSIVTFLMVFLIQKTQNRDSRAVHLKLNELLAAMEGASNRLINVEDLDEEALQHIYRRFQALAETSNAEVHPTLSHSVEEIEHDQIIQELDEALDAANAPAAPDIT